MAIEVHVHTVRSLAGAVRAVLDRMVGAGFENVDGPEDGRVEIDCLDGETGEEWGFTSPEKSAMEIFHALKERPSTVRVMMSLRHGHFLLFPGFVVLSRPESDYDEFEADPRFRAIVLREALEVAGLFHAREFLLVGDAASDFIGEETTTWEGLKDVLEAEAIPHRLLPVPNAPPRAV